MSTKSNPLFESPAKAVAPLALRPRDAAAALGVSEATSVIAPAAAAASASASAFEATNSPPPAATEGSEELPLIDVVEFAAKLGVSPQHIRRMADAGRCPPPIRLGRLVRWGREIVDDWIAAGCPVVRQPRLRGQRRD
jgi:predicted DNA-binding transcriptional regulator AlpA